MTSPSFAAPACHSATTPLPLRAASPLPPGAFGDLRDRLVLDGCKWDPQVGDVATLAPFPLVLQSDVWRQLASWAEQLTAEALTAEQELLRRPHLLGRLGLPWAIRRTYCGTNGGQRGRLTPPAARVMRFDFHPTTGSPRTGGWQISEANADVPGGFTEASTFTRLMARHYPGLRPAGDPGARWADAVAAAAHRHGGGVVALLCAAGFMEDQQVVSYLAGELRKRGLTAGLAEPRQLAWRGGRAWLETDWRRAPVAAVVRFYQGEWLAGLPRRTGWGHLFRGGSTPVANPGSALVIESKRFPLTWDALSTPLPTWRLLLPETRDPRDAPWRTDERWLLKGAFCNTGDWVCAPGWVEPRRWRSAARQARWFPSRWVAQRRFECVPIDTPAGPMFPCVGVYTINGRAAGIYGRLSPRPVVDYAATDVAVLVEPMQDTRGWQPGRTEGPPDGGPFAK